MDAKTLVQILDILPPAQAVLIRGDFGLGKSEIVRQLAQRQSKALIDVRASTMQEGDVVGYPDLDRIKETGVSSFALPSWYVAACEEPCVLFLDELNRGLIGVMNSLFQVVLDRELGNGPDGRPRRLHPQTQVIAAINVGSDYTVNEMDPALLSRFATYDFKPTVHDWLEWAQDRVDSLIIDFIRNHPEHLRSTRAVEPGRVAPSQRAWVQLNDALLHANIRLSELGGNAPDILYPLASGFVGIEAASALKAFVDTYESVIRAEDILDNWNDSLAARIKDANNEARLAIIEKIKTHCTENEWTLGQIDNLHSFFKLLTGEQKFSLHTSLMATSVIKNVSPYHNMVKDEIMPIITAAISKGKK